MTQPINRLSASNIETLKKLPEMGMGYQIITAKEADFTNEEIVVLNGQLAISRNALQNKNIIKTIAGDNFVNALNNAKEIHLTFDAAPFIKTTVPVVSEGGAFERKTAKNSISEKANGDELFVRLSAFEDDIRVDKENKCLLPGSYTTTAADALRCKQEGDDPVERYALPDDLVIQWAFYIQPGATDILQRGNVKEGFDKKGGGREAYFDKGTSIRTFIMQAKWAQ